MMLRWFAERQEQPIPLFVLDAIQNGIKLNDEAAAKQEFVQVPVEVVRELKRNIVRIWPKHYEDRTLLPEARELRRLEAQLPDPPKPDVVQECVKAFENGPNLQDRDDYLEESIRCALRRYRELGCPEIDG